MRSVMWASIVHLHSTIYGDYVRGQLLVCLDCADTQSILVISSSRILKGLFRLMSPSCRSLLW